MSLCKRLLSLFLHVGAVCLGPLGCGGPTDALRATLLTEGGHIEISGAALGAPDAEPLIIDVPPGAVDSPTEITIRRTDSFTDADKKEAGPALRMEPADLALKKPLQLSLPYYTRSISFLDTLWAFVGDRHAELANPLKNTIVSRPRRPYQVASLTLGGMQSLVVHPANFMGINDPGAVKNLDVLFVIDNSPSMADKQRALIGKFNSFIDQIMGCTSIEKFHIGVISSNVGLQDSTGKPWPMSGDPGCNSPLGDDGVLIGSSCQARGLTDDACTKEACLNPRVPIDGKNYIEIDITKKTTNVDVGMYMPQHVKEAFSCMAYLGEQGCSVEAPFEAVKRALGHASVGGKNSGFFQHDSMKPKESLLVLVFITDEDDCSIASARKDWSNPAGTMPYTVGSKLPREWQNFGHDFRCFAMSTQCNEAYWWEGPGVKTECKADPMQTYLQSVDELRKVLKDEYPRVLVAGIWPMNPTDVAVRVAKPMDPLYSVTDKGLLVDLEYNPAPPGLKESPLLRFKRQRCSKLTMAPMAASSPQYRLSTFAEDYPSGLVTGIPLASYQGDICDEGDYGLIAQMLQKALNEVGVTRCGP